MTATLPDLRRIEIVAALATILGLGTPVRAAPAPSGWAVEARARACGEAVLPTDERRIALTAQTLGAESLGLRAPAKGPLQFRWAVRLRSDDPALSSPLAGLAYDRGLGLVGATARGEWLRIRLENGELPAEGAQAFVVPMRGASGSPSAQSNHHP